MSNNKSPVCVIHLAVEIGDGNLHTPILFVVYLHMPMYPDGARVECTVGEANCNQLDCLVFPYFKF